METYRIGVIGDKDSVLGFMAVGFSATVVHSVAEASAALAEMAASQFAVIFLTEEYAQALSDEVDRYKDEPTPAVIPIPSRQGSTAYGMRRIKKDVERAVGADILFKEDE